MMKRMVKKGMGLLLTFVICTACFAMPASAEEHWAQPYIDLARDKGWLAQAGVDPSFPPDGGITYESLIMLVCEATGIKPWYSIDYFLNYAYENHSIRISEPSYTYKTFADAQNTRMNEQGYLRVATQFGLLVLSDYNDFPGGGYIAEDRKQKYREKALEPYRAALRGDAVMLLARGLGLVNPAGERDTTAALFTDWEAVPEWEKGWAGELYDIGVLTADDCGAARVGDPISLGETCQMVCAAYDYMTEGVDESICVEYSFYTGSRMTAWLPVPVQIVDGLIYVPSRTFFQTGIDFDYDYTAPKTLYWGWWNKSEQAYECEYWAGAYHYHYAGSAEYFSCHRVVGWHTALGPLRLLFGEVMFPIMTVDDARFYDGVVHIEVFSGRIM